MTTLHDTRLRGRYSEWWLAGATIFFGAFFLFQVEPLIAKAILPWFGGAAQVWTTCLLFFQTALLVGYLYAHLITEHVGPRWQVRIHVGLLIVSLVFLPVFPAQYWKPEGSEDPLLRILGLLTATIGLPFVLLSATNPLVQAWLVQAERERSDAVAPYRLFALSNFGSMLALLSYPLLIEPNLRLKDQILAWSTGYGFFVLLCSVAAWRYRSTSTAAIPKTREAGGRAPLWTERALWFALAAAPSALLLAVTNFMLQNIAAMPLLWIVPLALYLLSFIFAFGSLRWYWRPLWYEVFAGAIGVMIVAMSGYGALNNYVYLPIFALALFVCCLVCHAELASLRPRVGSLTSYYLTISAGGAVGGLFVAAVAPAAFNALYDLQILVPLTGFLVIVAAWRHHRGSIKPSLLKLAIGSTSLLLAVASVYLAVFTYRDTSGHVFLARNFYGALRVRDYPDDLRMLVVGTTDHGQELIAPDKRQRPVAYYTSLTGLGMVLGDRLGKEGPLNIGVIGLGAGGVAAYCRPGDTYRFYEINPLVLDIAQNQFWYLSSCPIRPALILGDARLSLEHEASQQFDALVVDAFISDAVPVHLLTQEAFALYWRHLKPDGVLVVHVTNRYIDLTPVVAKAADESGKTVRVFVNNLSAEDFTRASEWVVVTARSDFFGRPALQSGRSIKAPPNFRPWTDDFSTLWTIFRLRY